MHADRDDQTLVQLAVRGELSAFDELARRHQSTLARFLRRRLPPAEVEDAAQECLVRAYQRLGQCHTAFRAWLLAIAYRESIDRLRRPKPASTHGDEPAGGDDPSHAAMESEGRERLWGIARRVLSDEQYTVVWLFYADDLNAKEIAKVLGKSWVAVKVMLHRARGELEEAFEQAGFSEPVAEVTRVGES